MSDLQALFASVRSGVCQISVERNHDRLTAGTGFVVEGGLVTNSHVIREAAFDVAVFRFDDMDDADCIRLARETCLSAILHESPPEEHDIVYLNLNEPELKGRHPFVFGDASAIRVGDQIAFMGYPFQMRHLTCHIGYVSSLHQRGLVSLIQIDGSVNGGNSGGPLLSLIDGHVVGVITRAEVGFIADQFEALIRTLRGNVDQLQQKGGRVLVGGIDPVQGLRASQAAMLQIASTLRRSANVGIGYAYASDYIRDRIAQARS